MRQTKKLTLSAMTVALGTVLMLLGAVLELVSLSAAALASLLIAFIYVELHAPYTFLCWLCTSLATALLFPGSEVWLEYLLFFGIYPILKGYIERLHRIWWLPVKLVTFNAMLAGIVYGAQRVLGVSLLEQDTLWFQIAFFALCNVAFVAYDMFLTVMIRLYFSRFRPRFRRFLK